MQAASDASPSGNVSILGSDRYPSCNSSAAIVLKAKSCKWPICSAPETSSSQAPRLPVRIETAAITAGAMKTIPLAVAVRLSYTAHATGG